MPVESAESRFRPVVEREQRAYLSTLRSGEHGLLASVPQDVGAVLSVIHRRLCEFELGAGTAMDLAGIRSHTFPGRFREYVGCTLRQYVEHRRMLLAQRLLEITSAPVYEVSRAAGFRHHGSFSRAFRRHVGCSPRQYRRKHQRTESAPSRPLMAMA